MVIGLDNFRKYFEEFSDNYIIIGGTACDITLDEAGFIPRATKDIDVILIIEALTREFVKRFWDFIGDARYERNEKSDDGRKYYRFANPADKGFPKQVELFCRKPDLVDLEEPAHLTPIPADHDLSSLSAILMNDIYYTYLVNHSEIHDGLRLATNEALICLKAKAFLEIRARIAKGGTENSRHYKKHKTDIFRLVVLLPTGEVFELPEDIRLDLQLFAREVATDLPDPRMFIEMGLGTTEPEKVFDQFLKSFNLTV